MTDRVRRTASLVAAALVVAFVGLFVASALVVGLGVARHARDGRAAFDEGRAALAAGDANAARTAFERGRAAFASANERLGSGMGVLVRVVPVSGPQGDAVRAIVRAGALSSQAGRVAAEAVGAAPAGGWGLRQGAVDLASVERAAGFMRDAVGFGELASRELEAAPDGWLFGPVAGALHETRTRVAQAVDALTTARDGLERLPSLFARGGTKRYLVALANPAELRGTGGSLSYVVLVEAADGRLVVVPDSGRPVSALPPPREAGVDAPDWFVRAHDRYGATRLWQNVNISMDLPAVGSIVARGAAPELGPIDGVVLLTPDGLAALLDITGPVSVEAWSEPISEDNVAGIVQHEMFVRYRGDPERRDALMGELLPTVFERVVASDVDLRELTSLGAAAAGGHFQLFSLQEPDQTSLGSLGVAGGVDRAEAATDVLGFVTSNAVGNTIDWYLRREVAYRVTLDPENDAARTELRASLVNRAPARGESPDVIDPVPPFVDPGTNRQVVLIVRSPTDAPTKLESGGRTQPVLRLPESDLVAYHTGVLIPPGERSQVVLTSTITDAFATEGERHVYRLRVLRQPVPNADFYDVGIEAPAGWSVEGTGSFVGTLDRDLELEVTLRRTLRSRIVDRAVLDPWRSVTDLVSRIF